MAIAWINHHLDVQKNDPDIRRRGRLLNIMLLGFLIIAGVLVLVEVVLLLTRQTFFFGSDDIVFWALIFIVGVLTVGYINYRWSTSTASVLFLILITTMIIISDQPFQSVWLDPLSLLVVPVMIASMILRPSSSFIMATLVILIVSVGSSLKGLTADPGIIPSYYAVAFISWLTAHSLENALKELRVLNAELDARVMRRTHQLQLSNEKLVVARDKALEANRYKSELTARVSHELRTPLGSILGFSEMLRAGYYGPLTAKQKEPINKIIETDMELTAMINDLLDQARLESGKLTLDCAYFPIRNLIDYVRKLMQVLAHNKGLNLTCTIADSAPTEVYNDEMRVQQILVNLVGNAIKFTDHGRVAVEFYKEGGTNWAIQVRDTGRGIPEEALPSIFDTFQQADGSASREFAGSGLGLSIVEQLVHLMNGDILVESKVAEGTTITVVLPIVLQALELENG